MVAPLESGTITRHYTNQTVIFMNRKSEGGDIIALVVHPELHQARFPRNPSSFRFLPDNQSRFTRFHPGG